MDSDGVVPLETNKTFDPKMVNHTIDVYFFIASPPSRATLMLIKALGIKHNIKVVNVPKGEQLAPEYIKINPAHTIPAINDNGFILWESHAIMKYLVDQYAKDDSLFPKDAKKGAIVNQRLFFEASTLFPRFVDYAAPVFFHGKDPDPESLEKLETALGVLDTLLKNQSWVAGQYLTIADFSIISIISTIEACNVNVKKFRNIDDWYQRAKGVMMPYGYEEIMQAGSDMCGTFFNKK